MVGLGVGYVRGCRCVCIQSSEWGFGAGAGFSEGGLGRGRACATRLGRAVWGVAKGGRWSCGAGEVAHECCCAMLQSMAPRRVQASQRVSLNVGVGWGMGDGGAGHHYVQSCPDPTHPSLHPSSTHTRTHIRTHKHTNTTCNVFFVLFTNAQVFDEDPGMRPKVHVPPPGGPGVNKPSFALNTRDVEGAAVRRWREGRGRGRGRDAAVEE